MTRRRIALLVLLVCGLGLGGWLLAPAMPGRAPVAVEPPVDIETPAGRARLDAALALARMPDDPWTLAEALTVAPAASAAEDDKARCGEDQVPVFSATVPDADGVVRTLSHEARPGGVGYMGAIRRIDAALRASADPFDQGVADALNIGDVRTPAGRVDALVQDAVARDDPRLYQLAFAACNWAGVSPDPTMASCARLEPRRWAGVDAGNGVPWVFALQAADAKGDQGAQREALQHLASASRFDVHFGAAAATVARLPIASEADLAAQANLAVQAISLELAPPFSAVTMRCQNRAGGDAEMADTCEKVSDVLFDHSDTFIARAVGGSIHRLATGDPGRLDQAHREQRERAAHWTPATGFSPCGAERQMLKDFVRIGTLGEVAAMKEDLSKPVPP